jgi:hypothetical protein
MALYAQLNGVTNIKVEQMCEWSQHDQVGEDEHAGETDGGVRDVIITLSEHKMEAVVPFNGIEKHTVSPSSRSSPYSPLSPSSPYHILPKGKRRKTDPRSRSQAVNPFETQSPHTA